MSTSTQHNPQLPGKAAASYNAATKKNGSPVTPKTDGIVAPPNKATTASDSSAAPKKKKQKNRKRSQKARWSSDEDKLLRQLVKEHDAKNWKVISLEFPERTDVQCLHRWQKVRTIYFEKRKKKKRKKNYFVIG